MFPKIIFFGKWERGGRMDAWKSDVFIAPIDSHFIFFIFESPNLVPRFATASFFVMALPCFGKNSQVICNYKKDIVESGIKLLKKLLFDEFEVFVAFLCFDNQHVNAAWEFGNVDSGFGFG